MESIRSLAQTGVDIIMQTTRKKYDQADVAAIFGFVHLVGFVIFVFGMIYIYIL